MTISMDKKTEEAIEMLADVMALQAVLSHHLGLLDKVLIHLKQIEKTCDVLRNQLHANGGNATNANAN